MKNNLLALLFVVLSQVACAAIFDGTPSVNGPAADHWRNGVMWGK